MRPTAKSTLTTATLLLAVVTAASAQSYVTSPAPPPSPGLFNEWLRQQDLYNSAWDVGMQLRLRYEAKDNFFSGANDFKKITANPDNSYLLERLKPRVGYTAEWFSIFVEGRGSSTTGDDRDPNPESDGPMDLHQAYVTLGNHKEFPLSFKVGRQELSYGDERLIGAFDWNNLGRTFDAAKLRWQNPWFSADFFTSRVIIPDENGFNTANDYDWFSGIYATSKLIPKQTTELYFLSRNTSTGSPSVNGLGQPALLNGPSPRDIYTAGTRWKSLPGELGHWDYTVELAAQFGHFNDPLAPVKSLRHQAYMAFAGGGYTWTESKFTPRVGLEYNFASGDHNAKDGQHGTFENLFPTNHKFYGFMDTASLQNIHNLRLTSSIKPLPRLTFTGDFHLFWLADTHDNFYTVAGARRGAIAATPGTGYGINPGYGGYFGSELDLTATYVLHKNATIQGGFGHFFVGDYVKQSLSAPAVGSKDANWIYTQLTLNF